MTGSRARRNGVAPYMASMDSGVIDAMPEAQETARLNGCCKRGVASGMETPWPEVTAGSRRPGQRQQGWLCAKHDSPPGRPRKKKPGKPGNIKDYFPI